MPQDNDGTPPRPRRKRPASRRADSIRDAARSASGAESPGAQPEWWAASLETEADETRPGFDPQRTFGQWLESLVPPSAQVHFINAGREFATGVQMTVDHHLGRDRDEPETSGPIHIEID